VTLPDQRAHWDALRQRRTPPTTPRGPSAFAQQCATHFAPRSHVLELGCGPARDSAYFAGLGHTVCATDFSIAALAPARRVFAGTPGLDFCLLDTTAPLPFREDTFGVVYARLSLHYFPDRLTRRVFAELRRVLRPAGLLCFMCKSPGDPLYGQGRRLEPDMFELNGHLRHFFSPAYARSCLEPGFALESIKEELGKLYGNESAFVQVIARAH
jgi:SAM-dependent methyltransferase